MAIVNNKLGRLPREFRRLEKLIQTEPLLRGQKLQATYLHEANEVYLNKIKAFYKKNKETLKEKDFKLFVLTGINIFMYAPCRSFGSLKLWLDSGFVFLDHGCYILIYSYFFSIFIVSLYLEQVYTNNYRFSCLAARLAYIKVSREELSICPTDSSSDWLMLKMLMSFKLEREINMDSFFSMFNLEFKASSKIDAEKLISIEFSNDYLNVSKSISLNARLDDSEKPTIQIPTGTIVV